CVFLALFFGLMGLLRALSAGKDANGQPFANALKQRSDAISGGILNAPATPLPPEDEKKLNKEFYNWELADSKFGASPYIWVTDTANDKRENPQALTIKRGKQNIQLDYVRSLVFTHEYDVQNRIVRGLSGGAPINPMEAGGPGMKKEGAAATAPPTP